MIVFIECLRVLLAKHLHGRMAKYLLAVALAIFILCTIVSGTTFDVCSMTY